MKSNTDLKKGEQSIEDSVEFQKELEDLNGDFLKNIDSLKKKLFHGSKLQIPEEPDNLKLLEERKNYIEQMKSGGLRNKMVPLTIPEEVKKIKDFPKKSSLETKNSGDSFIDEGLIGFLNDSKTEKVKEEEFTVTLRVPKSVHEKLTKMVIQRSADTGEILNKSSYLRLLIEKDFKERTKIQF